MTNSFYVNLISQIFPNLEKIFFNFDLFLGKWGSWAWQETGGHGEVLSAGQMEHTIVPTPKSDHQQNDIKYAKKIDILCLGHFISEKIKESNF